MADNLKLDEEKRALISQHEKDLKEVDENRKLLEQALEEAQV